MVRLALIAAAAAALLAPAAAISEASHSKNVTGLKAKYAPKLAILERVENKTEAIKDEAWTLAATKLNKTIAMADKVIGEEKNLTKAKLNFTKYEKAVDAKIDSIVDLLNVTYAKVADVKDGVEAKVEEPVKMVDDKIDTLRIELEAKLAALKNKTAGLKAEADKFMDIKFKLPADEKMN